MEALRQLERVVRQTQAKERIPALSVALHRADRPLWTLQVGGSGRDDTPLGERTRFRLGSITKTFTAVAVMQCRDDGLIDLDDPIGKHLSLPAHSEMTIRRLLSHTGGLQREPFGDIWDSLKPLGADHLIAELDRAEQVLPTARTFHYSNLGFAMLGQLVGALRAGTWAEVVADRITGPLGLDEISVDPGERAAVGYLVDAYSDHARPEPAADFGAVGPAGQLWGSAAHLVRWAAFLADPATIDPAAIVLKASTLDEMRWPLTVRDEAIWASGFGLGLILVPQPDRVVHVGHDGAMPGFLAGAYGRRGGSGTPKACAAVALGSSGTASATVELPHRVLNLAIELDPADVAPWLPGPAAPPEYRSVLGRWWSEGFEFIFRWQDGALRAHRADDPAGKPPSVFAPIDGEPDMLRTISGREAGERLRLHRDPTSGSVVKMHWATYSVTRTQLAFDGLAASEPVT